MIASSGWSAANAAIVRVAVVGSLKSTPSGSCQNSASFLGISTAVTTSMPRRAAAAMNGAAR
jgi:hypothetical protein